MTFLVFGDPLGNPHAVAAILAHAKKLDGVELVCLGNAIGPAGDARACVEKLRKARVHLVRGAWDAAALGLPSGAELRVQAQPIAATLQNADLAYLKEATPPRRLVAGGRRILLTSETKPNVGLADVILHSGDKPHARREATRLQVCVGQAGTDANGESPFVVYDPTTGEAKVQYAAWDRAALRSTRQL